MSIATELQNYADGLDDAYDAAEDMGATIPTDRNMNNLDDAIRTIPVSSPNDGVLTITQNGVTVQTFSADQATNVTAALTDTTYSAFTGATSGDAGTSGLVPAPAAGDNTKYLKGDGTWSTVSTSGSYSGGNGINIDSNNEISIDTSVVAEVSDIPTNTSDLVNDGADGTSTYVEADELATVATSGLYSDLTGTPSLATVATSGDYGDLLNKPTIPAAQVNSDWDAVSGVSQILNKPTLATVATSGDYGDLLNKPTIPAAQVNSDWDAISGVAQILNKPTIPTVNDATLTITQNGTTAGTFSANASSAATIALTDTTYSAFGGATSSVAGSAGLVPAPTTSDPDKFLKGDGTWATPTDTTYTAGTNVQISAQNVISATDTTYSAMTGATSGAAGTSGLVPAPAAGDQDKVLKGDGTWGTAADPATVIYMVKTADSGAHDYTVVFYTELAHTNTVSYSTVNEYVTDGKSVLIIDGIKSSGSPLAAVTGAPKGSGDMNTVVDGSLYKFSYSSGTTYLDIGGFVTAPVQTSMIANSAVTSAKIDWSTVIDKIYPVGAIYMSVNSTSPATFIGGTWEQIKDRFILAAGTTYAGGATGGSATINIAHSHTVNSHNHSLPANTGGHTLTVDQIPAHTHAVAYQYNTGAGTARWGVSDNFGSSTSSGSTGGGKSHSHTIGGNTGDKSPGTNSQLSSSQSILPPYLAVYVWKRTA